jgi:hypothetical protein
MRKVKLVESQTKTTAQRAMLEGSALDRLLTLGAQRGIDVGPARAMHRLIDFSEPPIGYIRRIDTISKIAALRIGNTAVFVPAAAWIPYIEEVLKRPQEFADFLNLSKEDMDRFLAASPKDPLFSRGMTSHGLEALLWVKTPDGASAGTNYLLMLQAQLMAAQFAILEFEYQAAEGRGETSPRKEVFTSLYEPCMFARKFAESDLSIALPYLPFIKDGNHYADALDCFRSTPPGSINQALSTISAGKLDEALAGISSFIRRGATQKAYERRGYNGRKKKGPENLDTPPPAEDSPGSNDHARATKFEFNRTSGDATDRKELDQNGEAPEDHLPIRTFILTDGSQVTVGHILAAKARQNQSLPRRYREPQPWEYSLLIEGMRTHPERFSPPTEAKAAIAWTQFVFFQSCSPQQATELLVGYPTTPLEDCDFMLRMAEDSGDDGVFPPRVRVRIIEPPYETQYIPIEGERPRVKYFEIPDLGGVCTSVRDLLHELQTKGDRPEVSLEGIRERALKVFSQEARIYTKHTNSFAALIGLGDRVGVSGLGKVLFQRYVEFSDPVSAALITCSEPPLASVRRWYFSPKIESLRKVHLLGVRSVFAELPKSDVQPYPAALDTSKDCVGSRRCAEFGYVKQLVGFLQEIVEEPCAVRSLLQRREAFARRHNALSILAVWAIDLSVGMRTTTHPYFHASEYDHETGMGSLADKGEEKTRPFCLSRLTIKIASEYDKYLNGLAMYGLPGSKPDRPCYFVCVMDGQLKTISVTPTSISDFFCGTFLFAPNWARRMVKTLAIERGVPTIYTDAYCGHSNYGQEQYYTFTSFDPLPYFDCIRDFLAGLLKDLGFRVLTFDPSFLELRR